jgi:hypothetical protein
VNEGEDPKADERLSKRLGKDSKTITGAAHELLKSNKSERLLLVVDQFEELFILCSDPIERAAFIDCLLEASEGDALVSVLITLRADFYGHCGVYERLSQLLARQQEYITAMNRSELLDVIVQPLYCSKKWQIQEGLADLMLDEVGDEPGALSLLSHALLETWNRRRGVTLTLSGYQESGRIREAITKTAEDVYVRKLSTDQQRIAHKIFLRLTELGVGTQDTRRQVTVNELLTSSQESPDDVQKVLRIFYDSRLLVSDREEMVGWPTRR